MKRNRIKDTIRSTIECIRFPFLYPRNRFTGKHYNNWKIREKVRKIYADHSHLTKKDENKPFDIRFKFDVWWAKPYIKLLKFEHWFLSIFHILPKYTELDALRGEAPGWYKNFGIQICKEIRSQLMKDYWRFIKEAKGFKNKLRMIFYHPLFELRIMQWKEKYGEMRLYTERATPKVINIIDEYTEKSRHICIYCGKDADIITSPYNWMLPYCNECYKKYAPHAIIYYSKDSNGNWNEDVEDE